MKSGFKDPLNYIILFCFCYLWAYGLAYDFSRISHETNRYLNDYLLNKAIGVNSYSIIKNRQSSDKDNYKQVLFNSLKNISLALIKDENYQASVSMLESANLIKPNDCVVNFYLALAYLKINRPDLTKIILNDIHNTNDISIITALLQNYQSNFDSALNELSKVKAPLSDYETKVFYDLKTDTLLKLGILENAQKTLLEYAKTTQNEYTKIIIEAKSNFLGQITTADFKNLIQAGQIYPYDTAWHDLLAKYYQINSDFDKANQEYIKAFNCKRLDFRLYKDYTMYTMGLQNYKLALTTINHYLIYNPFSLKFKCLQSDAYLKLNQLDKAQDTLNTCIQTNPCYAEAYLKLSQIFYNNKNFNKCESVLLKLIDKCPQYPQGYFKLAENYEAQGNTKLALANYQKFINLNSKYSGQLNIFINHEIAIAYASLGLNYYKNNASEKLLKAAYNFNQLKFIPSNNILFAKVRPVKYSQSYKQIKDNPEINRILIADMLVEKNQFRDAISQYNEALKINPNDENISNYLNYVYIQQQDYLNSFNQSYNMLQNLINKSVNSIHL